MLEFGEKIFQDAKCAEVFDVMFAAFIHCVLFGDGNFMNNALLNNVTQAKLPQRPLHEKVTQLQAGHVDTLQGIATDVQIADMCQWMMDYIMFLALRSEILGVVKVKKQFLTQIKMLSEASLSSTSTVNKTPGENKPISIDSTNTDQTFNIMQKITDLTILLGKRHLTRLRLKPAGLKNINALLEELHLKPMQSYFSQLVDTLFGTQRRKLANEYILILKSDHFHSLNIHDAAGAKELVHTVVKLDRSSTTNSVQGLTLLREAWDAIDITEHLANRYKVMSRCLFATFLFLSVVIIWLAIICRPAAPFIEAVVTYSLENSSGFEDPNMTRITYQTTLDSVRYATFILAALQLSIISVTAFVRPRMRWQSLRASAIHLQGIVWKYRTRTGEFKVSFSQKDVSEQTLLSALQRWRAATMNSADLATSTLEASYPPHVYKHYQHDGPFVGYDGGTIGHVNQSKAELCVDLRAEVSDLACDQALSWKDVKDHFHWTLTEKLAEARQDIDTSQSATLQAEMSIEPPCPTKKVLAQVDDHSSLLSPEEYFLYRLLPQLSFYQKRLPTYYCRDTTNTFVVVILTVLVGLVAFFALEAYVALVVAVCTAVLTWREYKDINRKIVRYSTTIYQMKNLRIWWESLDDVGRTTQEAMDHLVLTTESLVAQESGNWIAIVPKDLSLNHGQLDDDQVLSHPHST